jgi:hypothetical protein
MGHVAFIRAANTCGFITLEHERLCVQRGVAVAWNTSSDLALLSQNLQCFELELGGSCPFP